MLREIELDIRKAVNNVWKSTKRQVVGTALENKMDKTATIEVERRFPHPTYNKYIRTKSIMLMMSLTAVLQAMR